MYLHLVQIGVKLTAYVETNFIILRFLNMNYYIPSKRNIGSPSIR